ncbi:TRAP transporter small permease [Paracoccus sp. TK19116]|uniref:TRAP transporter small permease protein n=1 Tax=Paracoccus albicereus TaxID=2922394 RepID=A0ABT1MQQ1_9RHOB|nr:TRAP transporter small permease [Paracoccus albicereus]MCQ0970630.1 TRAP transporter small permease [Paracoccus albicereus]
MLKSLRAVTDRLIGLSALIGTLALLFVVGVVLFDVIGRAFGSPLYGSLDMTTMAFVITVFGGMALCDKRGAHINVDLFERFLPQRMNHLLDILIDILGAAIFLAIGYAVIRAAGLSAMLNLRTNLLGLPTAWFQYALAALAIVTGIAMLLRAIDFIISGRSAAHGQHARPLE